MQSILDLNYSSLKFPTCRGTHTDMALSMVIRLSVVGESWVKT